MQMLVLRGLSPRENRCDTGVRAGEDPLPFIAGLGRKALREQTVHFWKRGLIHLIGHIFSGRPQPGQQLGEEPRFDGADGDVPAVGPPKSATKFNDATGGRSR